MKQPNKIPLAQLPTRIEKLDRISRELGKEIFLWRDDKNGFLEAGNKIRKLEYVIADALAKGATTLVTCGGPQSNHARATVVLAKRLGLGAYLVMRQPADPNQNPAQSTGNLLLDQIFGAEVEKISYAEYREHGAKYDFFLERAAERLKTRGETPYVIGEGASVPLGCFGYFDAALELKSTWGQLGHSGTGPDSLFIALGSGGTHAGLILGFDHHGLGSEKVWAVNICDSREYFETRVGGLIEQTRDEFKIPKKNYALQILDGHAGKGYGIATEEELVFYLKLAREDGVLLDPVYTGKAFRGMVEEIRRDGARFGKKILFLHSGGTLATFAYADAYAKVLAKNEISDPK